MSKSFFLISILIIAQISLSISASWKEGSKNCAKCNPVTKLCENVIKTYKNIYTLNKEGECEPSKNCIIGENYCIECSEEGNLCKSCDEGYFPDENGACSYSDNCEISFQGKCLKCKKNFVLNNNIGICKSINSEDFKNCKKTNSDGFCQECEEDYYLNEGDKRCIATKNG